MADSVFCTSHRPCHGLQRVSKQPVVTAVKGDFGELQAKGYQTSPPDTSMTSVLDQCGLNPHYLTQSQLGDGTVFALTHLDDKLGITGGPPARTSGSFPSDPQVPSLPVLWCSPLLLHLHSLQTMEARETETSEAEA